MPRKRSIASPIAPSGRLVDSFTGSILVGVPSEYSSDEASLISLAKLSLRSPLGGFAAILVSDLMDACMFDTRAFVPSIVLLRPTISPSPKFLSK